MLNYEYFHLYRKAINPLYWGLHTLINNLISDHNLSNHQIGGEITKFLVDDQKLKAILKFHQMIRDL